MSNQKFLVVAADILPEMIVKTLEVKRRLARGDDKSSNAACRNVGISRSAYYKYRESVFSYDEMFSHRIVTLTAILRDEPGVLMALLSAFRPLDANILTVNQNIPVDGAACVTISMRLSENCSEADIISASDKVKGVANLRFLSGK